jgi:hypothetical protein
MMKVQERVRDSPDYLILRNEADQAYANKITADEAFMAAQHAVNELWHREMAAYIEENDL